MGGEGHMLDMIRRLKDHRLTQAVVVIRYN